LDTSSDSIVVSFSSHWEQNLIAGKINLILRRRVPKSFNAKKMYLYIGSPKSSFIGVADIKSVEALSFEEALKELENAAISKAELEQYFQGYNEVGGYRISDIRLFLKPLSLQYVSEETGFSPPQSFVRVSSAADSWMEKHGLGNQE
jgi:predicted transcriptional regulator